MIALCAHGVAVAQTARKPANEEDFRYWLENMVTHHGYSVAEVEAATGLSSTEAHEAIEKYQVGTVLVKPDGDGRNELRVLPYPGGRHPRTGFLDGAVDPQRETKVSVFTPWDPKSYVVLDLPEAIWSNLGLTYLAHTHIPTIWDEKKETLEPLEWQRRADGSLWCERTLPNGVVFGTHVIPKSDHIEMEMWLKNGSDAVLSDLRVQNCAMLKAAKGFAEQSNENKVLRQPFSAARNTTGDRWIIMAWEPNHRSWANPPVPCLHSDPKFPDCSPGETQKLRGWFSFYQGKAIDDEFKRIRSLWLEFMK